MIDIFLTDDHTLLIEGIIASLKDNENIHISQSFTTIDDCRDALVSHQPDILLLDISMPDGSGVNFCKEVATTYPNTKVIALTVHDEYSVVKQVLNNGAKGYLLKNISTEELLKAIKVAHSGEQYICTEISNIIRKNANKTIHFTEREREILQLLINGYSTSEIASKLFISILTVKWHRKNLLIKVGVKNTNKLISLAIKEKLV